MRLFKCRGVNYEAGKQAGCEAFSENDYGAGPEWNTSLHFANVVQKCCGQQVILSTTPSLQTATYTQAMLLIGVRHILEK